MIASVHGEIESIGPDWVVVNVGGVGLLLHIPSTSAARLGSVGQEVHLHTHLVVREDDLVLYGFATPDDLEVFELLISASGIGPKVGLSILSTLSSDEVSTAIATGDMHQLTRVPGVGKKTAERLILELKDKVSERAAAGPVAAITEQDADVVAALTSLGYSVAEVGRAIASLPKTPGLTLEEKVKLALQYFGKK